MRPDVVKPLNIPHPVLKSRLSDLRLREHCGSQRSFALPVTVVCLKRLATVLSGAMRREIIGSGGAFCDLQSKEWWRRQRAWSQGSVQSAKRQEQRAWCQSQRAWCEGRRDLFDSRFALCFLRFARWAQGEERRSHLSKVPVALHDALRFACWAKGQEQSAEDGPSICFL